MKRTIYATMIIALTLGCSSKDEPDVIELSSSELSLTKGDEKNLNAKSQSSITYKSENDFHALVTQSGLVTANYVGSTNISLVNGSGSSKEVKVTIKPKYTTYEEPDMDFGLTSSQIISKYGAPRFTDAEASIYNGSGNVLNKIYLMTNGRVSSIGVTIPGRYLADTREFIKERYAYAYRATTGEVYGNSLVATNADFFVGTSLSASGDVMILYMKNPGKARVNSDILELQMAKMSELIRK